MLNEKKIEQKVVHWAIAASLVFTRVFFQVFCIRVREAENKQNDGNGIEDQPCWGVKRYSTVLKWYVSQLAVLVGVPTRMLTLKSMLSQYMKGFGKEEKQFLLCPLSCCPCNNFFAKWFNESCSALYLTLYPYKEVSKSGDSFEPNQGTDCPLIKVTTEKFLVDLVTVSDWLRYPERTDIFLHYITKASFESNEGRIPFLMIFTFHPLESCVICKISPNDVRTLPVTWKACGKDFRLWHWQ